MKQLLVCYKNERKLKVRHNILTDVFVPVHDIISPQKTTLIVPKTDKIEIGDIIIIKDNNSGKIEYIGYIDTLVNKTNTEISCYPIINIFDNDYVLDQMFKTVKKGAYNEQGVWVESATETEDVDVDAVEWLENQIRRTFIYNDEANSPSFNADSFDDLQSFPFIIERKTQRPVFYKKALDTANLFEVYVDLFINTGLYVVFEDLVYERNEIIGVKCEIRCNKDEKVYTIYEHEPTIQKVEITDNTFTNYNKIIATEEIPVDENGNPVSDREPQRFYFYLLNNNDITTNANDSRRIKQVRSKAISFDLAKGEEEENNLREEILKGKGYKDEDIKAFIENPDTLPVDIAQEINIAIQQSRAKALILSIYNELQAPEYDLKIEIDMLKNDDIFLYRKVDFVSDKAYNENGQIKYVIYTSNITKIERLNDLQVRITLGALRNSLTDFKKKVEAI